MGAAAILSIKPMYANQILAGIKTIELRKSSMGLNSGDVIVVETLSIASMWNRYHDVLGIEHAEYLAYFSDLEYAVALHVGEVQRVEFYFASGD